MGLFANSAIKVRDNLRKAGGPEDDFWFNPIGYMKTHSGKRVSEYQSLNYLTVYACISLISVDVSRLPLHLYQRQKDNSRSKVYDHPIYEVLNLKANKETSSFIHRESSTGHQLLWGNSYDEINYDRIGRANALWQFPDPGRMSLKRAFKDLGYGVYQGDLYYEWIDDQGHPKIYPRSKIFHIPAFGFNGLVGKSPIAYARENIGLALAMEEYGARYFADGMHPSASISLPPEASVDSEKVKEYAEYLKSQYGGLGKSHNLMVLPNGETFKQITMPAKDSQFIESREFQKVEICGLYHVPPNKIAIHGKNVSYNSLESENRSYIDNCLIHWTHRRECVANMQLLAPDERVRGLYIEHDFRGLLKTDTKSRYDAYYKLWTMGYPLNRLLEKDNENPVPGGDDGYIQINMAPLGQMAQFHQDQSGRSRVVNKRAEDQKKRAQSIAARDRISERHKPKIKSAAKRLVSAEANAVRSKINEGGTLDDIAEWIENYYGDFVEQINSKMGPAFRAFAEVVADYVYNEIGVEPDKVTVDSFISDYVDAYATRHSASSERQLMSLLRGDAEDLVERVDEWDTDDKRAEKIAENETTRLGNAVYQTAVFAAGFSTYWRLRGKSCPLCQMLSGKLISRGQMFLKQGETLDPDDGETTPLKTRTSISNPPLHQGCDCYLSIF